MAVEIRRHQLAREQEGGGKQEEYGKHSFNIVEHTK